MINKISPISEANAAAQAHASKNTSEILESINRNLKRNEGSKNRNFRNKEKCHRQHKSKSPAAPDSMENPEGN